MRKPDYERLKARIKRLSGILLSRQTGIFLIFLVISTVLWFFTSLNEEIQRQITCRVVVRNVPDSVTFISDPPGSLSVSVRCRGTHMIRQFFGSEPTIEVDFRNYSADSRLTLSKSKLFGLVQNNLGDDRLVQSIYPDTIGVYYTTLPPVRLPVRVAATATASPNAHIIPPLLSTTDSVYVYGTAEGLRKLRYINTADIHFTDINKTTERKVRLATPAGTRAIPDSVTIKINVEPFVTESRMLDVEVENVPEGVEMIVTPGRVRTSYRVPRSMANRLPQVRVVADYNSIADNPATTKIAINTDPWVSYIFLDADSVDFYLRADSIINVKRRDAYR